MRFLGRSHADGWRCFALALLAASLSAAETEVGPVPADVRARFQLAQFYQKHVDAGGLPVVASGRVSDFALIEARYLVREMTRHRPELLAVIARNRVRLAVMAHDEFTTAIPEHRDLKPADYWDWRARGLGATEARPAVSCGEENLLGFPGDPYWSESVLVHEFGHVLHERGMTAIDPTFQRRLEEAFAAAQRAGRWRNTYASRNPNEYWAEGVQSWFDTNRELDRDHNHVNTRAELRAYDPPLAALLAEVLGDGAWRYRRPAERGAPAHLAGYDPATAPPFRWPEHLITARRRHESGEPATRAAAERRLTAHAPDSRRDWRTPAVNTAQTTVFFRNGSAEAVAVDWIDFEGRPQSYYTIRPGELVVASTYAGHVWRVTQRGGAVAYFVAAETPATAVIEPAG